MVGKRQFQPDTVLDAALRVFWERSYAAASISDLVAATGLSRGSLYAAFGDKQALFLACLDRYVDTVGTSSRAALDQPGGVPRERVMAGFDAIFSRMADPAQPAGCLLAQTAAESGSLETPVRAAVQRILDGQVAQMRRVLAASGPGVPDADLESLARYVVTVAQALAVMHRAGTSVDDLRAIAVHAVRALDVLAA